jgi:2-dehydropantoate 2-reductase
VSSVQAPGPVWVLGAGLVGTYLGGRLALAGCQVHFIGRRSFGETLAAHGLTLTDLDGFQGRLDTVSWHTTLPAEGEPALVLLCVKSADTAGAARQLAERLKGGSRVLSFQNGVDNMGTLRANAPELIAVAGMVPFNVSQPAPGRLHQGTSGALLADNDASLQAWQGVFSRAGLPLHLRDDMAAVQWAKLLLNLNNPINALSGLPLREQLLDRDWRACTAALMEEALAVLDRAGQSLARLTPLPPAALPTLLRTPNWLFRRAAARMLRIDAQARSSMADDVARGRVPEIDALCGAVVRLGRRVGVATPRNALMVSAFLSTERPQRSAQAWRRTLESALS